MFNRPLTTSDHIQARKLWSLAFPEDSPAFMDWFFAAQFPKLRNWSTWEDDRLLAVVYAMPYELICRNKHIPTAFILGVATHPGARKRGLMRRLMHLVHEDLAQSCLAVCLHPAVEGFYQKLGYSFVSHHRRIRLPVSALTPYEPQGHISSAPDFSRLAAINREHTQQMGFFAARGPSLLERRYDDLQTMGGPCFMNERAYAFVEPPQAVGAVSSSPPACLLPEFSYTDFTAGCALLSAIAAAYALSYISFSLPTGDTPVSWAPYTAEDPSPFLMLKGFDLAALATGMRVETASGTPRIIRLLDDHSLWSLSFVEGTVHLLPLDEEAPHSSGARLYPEPHTSLTRDQFIRLAFGYSDTAALAAEGVAHAGCLDFFSKVPAAFFDMY